MIQYDFLEDIRELKELVKESRPKKLMDIQQVSEYTTLSPQTLRRAVKIGALKPIRKKGKFLFQESDVRKWLNG